MDNINVMVEQTYWNVSKYRKECYKPIKDLARQIIERGLVKELDIYISNFNSTERMLNFRFDESDKLYIDLEHYEITLADLEFEQLYWLLDDLKEFVEENIR